MNGNVKHRKIESKQTSSLNSNSNSLGVGAGSLVVWLPMCLLETAIPEVVGFLETTAPLKWRPKNQSQALALEKEKPTVSAYGKRQFCAVFCIFPILPPGHGATRPIHWVRMTPDWQSAGFAEREAGPHSKGAAGPVHHGLARSGEHTRDWSLETWARVSGM